MNVGMQLELGGKLYQVISIIDDDGNHADVFQIVDESGGKFLLKKFKDRAKALAWIPYRSTKNHFGRTRDVHHIIFSEIRAASLANDFLVEQIVAEKYWYEKNGEWTWCWVLIQEFVEGITIGKYIEDRTTDDLDQLLKVFNILGATLREWHSSDFAHGDPHLYNAMIEFNGNEDLSVTLVDYSQLHHPSFEYCKICKCFEPKDRRFQEDLENWGVMGKGFLTDIVNFERKLKLENSLFQTAFWEGYRAKN